MKRDGRVVPSSPGRLAMTFVVCGFFDKYPDGEAGELKIAFSKERQRDFRHPYNLPTAGRKQGSRYADHGFPLPSYGGQGAEMRDED